MKKQTLKAKFLGSTLVVMAIVGLFYSTASVASAKLLQKGNRVVATGTVISVNLESNQFTFQGTGTESVAITVTENTQFYGIISGLSDLEAGDLVYIKTAKIEGTNYADKVKKITQEQAYGHAKVVVNDAKVVSKTDTTLVVKIGATNTTFYIAPETVFTGKSFADLSAGDKVKISANDNGSTYLAKKVAFVQ